MTEKSDRTDDDSIGGAALSSLGARKVPSSPPSPAEDGEAREPQPHVTSSPAPLTIRPVRPAPELPQHEALPPIATVTRPPSPWARWVPLGTLLVILAGVGVWWGFNPRPNHVQPLDSNPGNDSVGVEPAGLTAVVSIHADAGPDTGAEAVGEIVDEVLEGHDENTDDNLALIRLYANARYGPPAPVSAVSPAVPSAVGTNGHAHSVSIGRPSAGHLRDGVRMRSGPGYVMRFPHRAWGTRHTVELLSRAIETTKRRFPEAHDLAVGDLSLKGGGPMRPHRSHQSGRDADVSYYVLGDQGERRFPVPTVETLDLEKVWFLFETLLNTKMIEYLFVDYGLQRPLYEYALSQGHTRGDLEHVFEYPRRKYAGGGIIRHSRGHDDHFHVRVACRSGDEACK